MQAAQAVVKQISTTSSQNQEISASVQQTLQTQISSITTQIGNLQQTELAGAQTQITNLETQEQTEYHLIQLNFGNSTNAASVLTSLQTTAKSRGGAAGHHSGDPRSYARLAGAFRGQSHDQHADDQQHEFKLKLVVGVVVLGIDLDELDLFRTADLAARIDPLDQRLRRPNSALNPPRRARSPRRKAARAARRCRAPSL